MKQFFPILVLITGLFIAPLAVAGDLIISRGMLEDSAGTLTIADVAGREFKPVGPTLSKGITKSVHWLRLQVQAPSTGSKAVLLIRQPFLNEIRLYEADTADPQGWKTRVTGNYYPFSERDRATSSLSFVVNAVAPVTTYYLRLKTSTPSLLSVEALQPDEAKHRDYQFNLMAVFFTTAMLLLLCWAIHSYMLDRLPVVGLFAVHQAVYTVYGIAVTGYLAPFIPDGFPRLADWTTAIPYCAVSFTILLFCRELFKPYQPPPVLMRGLNMFLLVFPLQLLAMALGFTPLAVIVNAVLIKIMWWYFVVMTFTFRSEHSPSRRLLQCFFVTITLVFTLYWLSNYSSLVRANLNIGRQVLIANGLIIGCLFAMILNARLRSLLQEAQQSATELLLTQNTLDLERTLKEQAEIQARTDYLTGIFNRRHVIELGQYELARALRSQRPVSLLMIDIDRFKVINDTWGHSAGDMVLQQVAHLIRNALRTIDIVGRIGGEEFAAMLVETDVEQAMSVAQRLRAAVAGTTIISPQGAPLQVTISLGLTGSKGRNINFDRLLHEADMALYSAKQSGRNKVVCSTLAEESFEEV